MNKEELENRILSLIEINQGMKGQELVLKLMSLDLNIHANILMDTIFDLIERGDLVEIEYQSPNHNSRSFITPRGTIINVVNKVKVK